MVQSIWASRPADIYGRRQRDRLYTAIWGLATVLGGFSGEDDARVATLRK